MHIFKLVNLFQPFLVLTIITLASSIGNPKAQAHIEADMPDPIAEIEYQMMLDFEPEDKITRYKLAMVYYRLEKDKKAEAELSTVLKNDPLYFHALEGMGMLLLRQNNFSQALIHLEKAVLQKESESGTFYYLGQAKRGIADIPGAKTALTMGLEKCLAEEESKRAISVSEFQEALAIISKPL